MTAMDWSRIVTHMKETQWRRKEILEIVHQNDTEAILRSEPYGEPGEFGYGDLQAIVILDNKMPFDIVGRIKGMDYPHVFIPTPRLEPNLIVVHYGVFEFREEAEEWITGAQRLNNPRGILEIIHERQLNITRHFQECILENQKQALTIIDLIQQRS